MDWIKFTDQLPEDELMIIIRKLKSDKRGLIEATREAAQTLSNLAAGELAGEAQQIEQNAATKLQNVVKVITS